MVRIQEDNFSETEISITPSILKAYLVNMSKAVMFIAAIMGSHYAVVYLVGENPYPEILKTLGIPMDFALQFLVVCAGIFLVLIIFHSISIGVNSAKVKGKSLTYSYGILLKRSNEVAFTNIVKVNFNPYPLSKTGDLKIHLSGTAEDLILIPYVGKVEEKCVMINDLIQSARTKVITVSNQEQLTGESIASE